MLPNHQATTIFIMVNIVMANHQVPTQFAKPSLDGGLQI
jgi:hypothetical protein